VALKALGERLTGKQENNGIYFAANDTLIRRIDEPDPAILTANIETINAFVSEADAPVMFGLIPSAADIWRDRLPTGAPSADEAAWIEEISGRMTAPTVDLRDTLQRHSAEDIYYRTDHHWTSLGAYYAYTDLMRAFGMEDAIIPTQAFERTVVSTSFYGSSWSAAGMKFVSPDTVEVWTLGNEDAFSITLDNQVANGFYAWEHLAKKDHYSLFLDGVHDVVTVRKTGEERPTLLILKDSFANSLAPFLAQHFDLVLLNLSSTRTDFINVSMRAEEYGADAVLVLYTLGNVIENEKIANLR
jgi:hypothetical protein